MRSFLAGNDFVSGFASVYRAILRAYMTNETPLEVRFKIGGEY